MDGQNKICWVCFPQRDGAEPMQGELAAARRRFFADPKHTVSLDKDQNVKGFGGHVRGKLSKRSFYWKKRITGTAAGEVIVEEAFGQRDGWVLVVRDMYGVIVSRSFFDRKHEWLRTEYYEPWDSGRARVSFTPGGVPGTILRRDWDPETKHYHDTLLYGVPYRSGTAGQSVVDAQIGEPQLLIAMSEGEMCFCPKEEADARLAAMKNVNSGTVVLMPAWEIKGGELVREDGGGDGADVTFTSLEEYARIEPEKPGRPREPLTGETLPAPERPLPPAASEFVPEQTEPADGLPLIEPHEARHMREPETPPKPTPVPPAPSAPEPQAQVPPQPAPAPMPPVQNMSDPMHMSPVEEQLGHMPMLAAQEQIQPAPVPVPAAPPVREPPRPQPVQQQPVPPAQSQPRPAPMPPMPPMPPAQEPPQPAPAPPRHERPAHGLPAHEAPPREPMPIIQAPKSEDEISLESILAEAAMYSDTPPLPEPSQETSMGMTIPNGYTGDIKNGKISGRGRTEQRGGMTSYEGDYVNGKREGFGTYYYKDGNLCYAGAWKDDRRDGLGVSFRDSDHALHVANWKDGQPSGLVTLFDSEGNLRYSGRMENGRKEGAGVVINGEDGTVFVGQWAGGETTGLGSAFDREGRLLYYGSWKDGKRHGHGTEFDLHGGVVFDGEFRDGKYFNGVLYQKL